MWRKTYKNYVSVTIPMAAAAGAVNFPTQGAEIMFAPYEDLKRVIVRKIEVITFQDCPAINIDGVNIVPLSMDDHAKFNLSLVAAKKNPQDPEEVDRYIFKDFPLPRLSNITNQGKDQPLHIEGLDLGRSFIKMNAENNAGLPGRTFIFNIFYD